MPPKRPASSAFKPPRSAGGAVSNNSAKSKSKPKTTSGTNRSTTSKAAQSKFGTDPSRKKSRITPQTASSDVDSDEDDEEDSQLGSEAEEGTATSASMSDDQDDDQSASDDDSLPQTRTGTTKSAGRPITAASRLRSPSAEAPVEDTGPPIIPEKLLTALLHSHFQQPDTKIGREARGLVGRYVETFIREAVARAVVERKGGSGSGRGPGAGGGGGDFLEVEDLEKLAPQLILDF